MRRHVQTLALSAVLASGLTVASPSIANAQTFAPPQVAAPSPIAPTTGSPFAIRGLFADTIQDFRRLPSIETVAILSIGGLGAAIGHPYDPRVSQTFSSSTRMREALGPGQTLGGARMQMASAIATYTIGRVTRHEKVSMIGADLIRAQLVTQTLTAGIKLSVGRTRPDGTQYSFPSGHSSVSFATATVLQRNLGWKVGIPAYGFATYVAASRVQAKRHYLSDVAFGAAIGIVAGRTVTIGRGDTKFALSPMATRGGAGVSLTLVDRN
jgi:membrane-associated phospholipid phosphatase